MYTVIAYIFHTTYLTNTLRNIYFFQNEFKTFPELNDIKAMIYSYSRKLEGYIYSVNSVHVFNSYVNTCDIYSSSHLMRKFCFK